LFIIAVFFHLPPLRHFTVLHHLHASFHIIAGWAMTPLFVRYFHYDILHCLHFHFFIYIFVIETPLWFTLLPPLPFFIIFAFLPLLLFSLSFSFSISYCLSLAIAIFIWLASTCCHCFSPLPVCFLQLAILAFFGFISVHCRCHFQRCHYWYFVGVFTLWHIIDCRCCFHCFSLSFSVFFSLLHWIIAILITPFLLWIFMAGWLIAVTPAFFATPAPFYFQLAAIAFVISPFFVSLFPSCHFSFHHILYFH